MSNDKRVGIVIYFLLRLASSIEAAIAAHSEEG